MTRHHQKVDFFSNAFHQSLQGVTKEDLNLRMACIFSTVCTCEQTERERERRISNWHNRECKDFVFNSPPPLGRAHGLQNPWHWDMHASVWECGGVGIPHQPALSCLLHTGRLRAPPLSLAQPPAVTIHPLTHIVLPTHTHTHMQGLQSGRQAWASPLGVCKNGRRSKLGERQCWSWNWVARH